MKWVNISLLLVAYLFCSNRSCPQPVTDPLLLAILKSDTSQRLSKIINDPFTYRCQIIYTMINRDKNNIPHFKNYYFNYDPLLYFNPASTVKLPLALLSLEKLNSLKGKGIDRLTTVQFDSSHTGQIAEYKDSTSGSGLPSIAHYIKRAFLISENDPYNRMYQFVGQQQINRELHKKGYKDVRITRQFMGLSAEQNRYTNQVRFVSRAGKLIFKQPPAYNTDSFDFSHKILLGRAYLDRHDSLVNEPFDFTRHNNISIYDLQQILQSALFPHSVPPFQRFRINHGDYNFICRYLSQFPSETDYPKYDTSLFYDSYVKFFFRESHHLPPNVRVFNKAGWSYGFLTDVSYIIDFRNKVEFMLAATVYVNSDGVLNDNSYDYDAAGYPFLYELGQTIYSYELKRKHIYQPDLSAFKLKYDHRNSSDKRPSLRIVDN